MPNARDVILRHIDAFNGRDSDADPWAADAEFTAPGAEVSGRDDVIGFIAVFQEAFPGPPPRDRAAPHRRVGRSGRKGS